MSVTYIFFLHAFNKSQTYGIMANTDAWIPVARRRQHPSDQEAVFSEEKLLQGPAANPDRTPEAASSDSYPAFFFQQHPAAGANVPQILKHPSRTMLHAHIRFESKQHTHDIDKQYYCKPYA